MKWRRKRGKRKGKEDRVGKDGREGGPREGRGLDVGKFAVGKST